MNRLRDGGRNLLGFKSCERGVEDCLRAAKLAQKLANQACAEARRERERQPSQVLVGIHRSKFVRREAYFGGRPSVKYEYTMMVKVVRPFFYKRASLLPASFADGIARWRRNEWSDANRPRVLLELFNQMQAIEQFSAAALVFRQLELRVHPSFQFIEL